MHISISKRSLAVAAVALFATLALQLLLTNQVHAAVDTCTWTGAATGTVSTSDFTITYDMADGANWSGCDNSNVPEDGDTLVFPANLAQVDPGGTLTDDGQWKYLVDNTLVADTSFAGIQFTGDTGATCQYEDAATDPNNDTYYIVGNAVSMAGNIDNSYTGTCSQVFARLLVHVTVTTDVYLDADITAEYIGSTYIDSTGVAYGDNTLNMCNPLNSESAGRNVSLVGVDGDGPVFFNCATTNFNFTSGGYTTGRDVTVATGSSLRFDSIDNGFNNITLKDGASLNYSFYNTAEPHDAIDIPSNIIIEGSGESYSGGGAGGMGGGVPTFTSTLISTEYASAERLTFSYSSYDMEGEYTLNNYHQISLTGDLTFTEDLDLRHFANLEISGKIVGNDKKITAREGSTGEFTITSTDNTSATKSGSQPFLYRVTEMVGEYGFGSGLADMFVSGGNFTILKTAVTEAKDVVVHNYGKLGGIGTVANLNVLLGGVLAPGLSPGCISSGDLALAGTYEVEINGATVCTQYDQTDVTGTVDVTGGTLDILKLASYEPAEGAVFIIIKNDGADTVTGNFTGLVEGTTTTVDGVEYAVSYEGGDGNDVTLTVASNPDAPDTGFTSTTVNFLFIALATMLATSGMIIAGRKLQ